MFSNKICRGHVLRIAIGILAIILLVSGASAATFSIGFGETKSGRIGSTGIMDTYTFTANGGDTVLIRMDTDWVNYPEIRLYAPNGSLISDTYAAYNMGFVQTEPKLNDGGIYKILVGDVYGAKTGNYTLYLQSTNNPGNATNIGFGETKSANIKNTSEMDTYTFTANGGDTVLIRMDTDWVNYPEIRLYAPNGSLISDAYAAYNMGFVQTEPKLNDGGIYKVLVGDVYGAKKGNYTLFLQRPNNPGNATNMGFGETKSANIKTISEMDTFTFTANGGDTVLIRMDTDWVNYPEIRLYAPNGSLISDAYAAYNMGFVQLEPKLNAAGIYKVLVGDVYGAKKGNYTLYLQRTNNPGNATNIGFGETKSANIKTISKMDTYTFTANGGDTVLIRMDTDWVNYPEIRLYAPNGSLISDAYAAYNMGFVQTEPKLNAGGIYKILVGDVYGAKTGNYTLYLQRTNNPGNASNIGFGETKSANIKTTSEMDTFTFTACPGENILIRMNANWVNYPEIRLYAPNGSLISDAYAAYNMGFVQTGPKLNDGGIYKILVGDVYGAKTGNYTLYLESTSSLSCIIVTTPDGGENWQAGTNQIIRWLYSGNPGSSIKIELLKTGVLNGVINSSTPIGSVGSGSYNWPINLTQTPGTNYKVKITSLSNSAYNDTSNSNFTISSPASSITVVTPNGGENWASGMTQTILWNFTGTPGSFVNITLLKGGVFNRIINSSTSIGSSGSGSYNWLMNSTQTLGSDYKVRITSTTNSAYNDTSNNNFTITVPGLTVVSPNGGETWARGLTQTIKWTYAGNPGSSVRIELMKGGVLNSTINSSTSAGSGGSGSYIWLINSTQTLGSDYKVRVTSTTDSAYNDTSNNNFTIGVPGITVVSPNGGETWTRGLTQTIKWTYIGTPGSFVNITLLKGDVFNRTINSSTSIGSSGSGSYNWLINSTQTLGSDYKIRVTSTSSPAYTDTSNNNFTIIAPISCNTSTIYGYSFNDTNSNKTMDSGEIGISNRTINLKGYDTCTRTLVSKIIATNTTGYFAFTSINPGSYMLSEDYVLGWLPTTDAAYTLSIPSVSVTIRKDFGNKKFI